MRKWSLLAGCSLLAACAATTRNKPAPTASQTPAPVHPPLWGDAFYAPFHTSEYASGASLTIPSRAEDVDTGLLSAAVFVETNAARTREGVPAVEFQPQLRQAAQDFAQDMVRLNFFAHEGPDPSRRTWDDRMRLVGLTTPSGGENIAMVIGLEYPSGRPFSLPSSPGDPYRDPQGVVIPIRTYQGLAQAVVKDWLASPQHRANLLDRDWTHLGAACSEFSGTAGVATFKCVQEFAKLPGSGSKT